MKRAGILDTSPFELRERLLEEATEPVGANTERASVLLKDVVEELRLRVHCVAQNLVPIGGLEPPTPTF